MRSRTRAVCRGAAGWCVCCQAWVKDTRYPPLTWEECIIQRVCSACVCEWRGWFRHSVTKMRDDKLRGPAFFLQSAGKLIDKVIQRWDANRKWAAKLKTCINTIHTRFILFYFILFNYDRLSRSPFALSPSCAAWSFWRQITKLITSNELAKARSC